MEQPKKLYRNKKEGILAGVCAGVANYFSIDPVIVRIIWAALCFCATFGFWAYIIAAILLPDKPDGAGC